MPENVTQNSEGASRKFFSPEDKARIVLAGLGQEETVSELCRREGIAPDLYNVWLKTFVEGGKRELAADTVDQLDPDEESGRKDSGLFRSIVENCPANLLMSRLDDGKVLFRSPTTQAIFGTQEYTRNHWVSQDARELFVERLKRDGRVDNMFFMARRSDGTGFPALLTSRLFQYRGETVIASTSIDLTQINALRAESAQADSRLRDAIEALGEGFVLYDQNERFVMANQRYSEIMAPYKHLLTPGTPVSEITGQAVRDGYVKFVSPPKGGFEALLKAVIVGKPSQIEIQLADGTQKIATLSRIRDGGLVATIVDITDRRQVEARAREMMTDIIESLDEGISLYDPDLKFVMRNNRRYEMLSERDHTIEPGQHLKDVTLHLASSGRILLAENETPEQWSNRIVELTRQFSKNIEVPGTDNRLYLLSAHKTKLGGHLLVFQDVTEQRRAEKAGREADELLRTIVEACPTTFLVSTIEDGKIIYYPPASRDRFGDIESTLEFFLKPDDRVDYLNKLLPTGILDDYRVRFRRRDGTIMDGLTAARVTDYKGQDVIVSSTRDISDQLAMQAELERQREIAHQNEKLSALGELLAGVAHELNNPLSIVVGYALMLQNKVEDPKHKEQIERIGNAAERCAKIVKMFLAMARQRPMRIENCSLNEILETVIDVSGYGLKAAGVVIKLDLDPDLPPVAADPDQMAQVFTNLIVNAEHALSGLGEQGRLTLTSYFDTAPDEVVVEVRDNGAGVSEDIQARIFEPFFTTKEVGQGTGIGLAFCHRIVSYHDGKLTLQSTPGQGAAFTMRMKAEIRTGETAPVEAEPAAAQENRRILVVDDEDGVADLIHDILKENGFQVETRNDPRLALDLLRTQTFDLILSDVKMPGLDGEAFLEGIEKISPHHARRTVFITGDGMSSDVAGFFERTGCRHLEKPIAPADLITFVKQMCALGDDGLH